MSGNFEPTQMWQPCLKDKLFKYMTYDKGKTNEIALWKIEKKKVHNEMFRCKKG